MTKSTKQYIYIGLALFIVYFLYTKMKPTSTGSSVASQTNASYTATTDPDEGDGGESELINDGLSGAADYFSLA